LTLSRKSKRSSAVQHSISSGSVSILVLRKLQYCVVRVNGGTFGTCIDP
jgi:hypothetical protein